MKNSEKSSEVVTPLYYKIAMDIASRIADGQYQVGERVYSRSTIASRYGVSPETARKAISILADLDIVEAERGSGVTIRSADNAVTFVQQFQEENTVHAIKSSIFEDLERQRSQLDELEQKFRRFVESAKRFRDTNPFVPFSIDIEPDMAHLNETTAETNFWHRTSATVIAIRRRGEMIISPGPYATFEPGDTVYFIGDENAYEKVVRFMSR